MFANRFEELYKGVFQLQVDDEDKVFVVQNGFDVVYSVEEKQDGFLISKEFLYGDDDSYFKVYCTRRKQLIFMQCISKLMSSNPFVDNDIGMCPHVTEAIGYIVQKDDWEALSKAIIAFETVLKSDNQFLDIQFLQENFSNEYEYFCTMKSEMYNVIKNACDLSDYYTYEQISKTNFKHKIYFKNEPVFVDEHGTIIVGVTEELLLETGKFLPLPARNIERSYNGFKYYFGNSQSKNVVVDIRLVNEALRMIDQAFYDGTNNITYKMNDEVTPILVQCGEIWTLIAPIRADIGIVALEEREAIRQMSMSLDTFIPVEKAKEVYLFETLDDSLFEKLCKDLLVEIGFKNVILRGSTNAADGGIDVEADEERVSLFGTTEIRHWIFQCKHTKAQFGRKDAAEIPCLLRDFKADCYGVFYSRVFTPQTLDRLKSIDCTLQYWGKNEMETLLDRYRRVAIRYFGL